MDFNNIRNFVIISHIDHGKSTLADRFLELTKTISADKMHACFLDAMSLEKEKGITIKMHPCRMLWQDEATQENYILNLIDTPGHIDFSYEISRALAAVEGAVLLVDASQGIQAQTLYNLEQAQQQGLKIIGAVNKIDLPEARVEETKKELAQILDCSPAAILAISGKTGTHVPLLIRKIVEVFPPPQLIGHTTALLEKGSLRAEDFCRALIFDSQYDTFSGVTAFIRVFEGIIKKGEEFFLSAAGEKAIVKEVGYFLPQPQATNSLKAGEIGYIKTGIKEPAKVRVGDTVVKLLSAQAEGASEIVPLPGYKESEPVLFLSLYPQNTDDFENLKEALEKLRLNDPTLNFHLESKMALGRGFRCGFLGSLHAEITARRIKEEYDLDLIITSPQVIFKVIDKHGETEYISSPADWPAEQEIKEVQEPWVELEIISPNAYFNPLFKILKNFRALITKTSSLTKDKSLINAETALREIIRGNFYDKLKGVSQGYASFNFRQTGFRKADLVKLDVLITGQSEEAFARIIPRTDIFEEGRLIVKKLKELLPAQQFSLPIQAAVAGRVIARETIKARRKDVTASLYGGDVTRKQKLLKKQKKGKKKLRERGRINLPPRVFLEMSKD